MTNDARTNLTTSAKCRQQIHAWIDRYFDGLEAQLAAQLKKACVAESVTSLPEKRESQGNSEPSTAGSTEQKDEKLEQFFRYMRNQA